MSTENQSPLLHVEQPESRTYPREWFRIGMFGGFERREMVRETDKCLFFLSASGRERRVMKVTEYEEWLPTLEAARERLEKIAAHKAAKDAAKRLGDAAPELLAVLQKLLTTSDTLGIYHDLDSETVDEAEKLIARIEGRSA